MKFHSKYNKIVLLVILLFSNFEAKAKIKASYALIFSASAIQAYLVKNIISRYLFIKENVRLLDNCNTQERYQFLKQTCSNYLANQFWKDMLFKIIESKNDEQKLKEIADYLTVQLKLCGYDNFLRESVLNTASFVLVFPWVLLMANDMQKHGY